MRFFVKTYVLNSLLMLWEFTGLHIETASLLGLEAVMKQVLTAANCTICAECPNPVVSKSIESIKTTCRVCSILCGVALQTCFINTLGQSKKEENKTSACA